MNLKNLFTPKGSVLGSQDRANQVSKEEKQRIQEVAIKVIEVFSKEDVTVSEAPGITVAVLAIINKKIDNAIVDTVIREL